MRKTKKAVQQKKKQQNPLKKTESLQQQKQNAWKSFWDRYCQM